jgi:hypothetical protein
MPPETQVIIARLPESAIPERYKGGNLPPYEESRFVVRLNRVVRYLMMTACLLMIAGPALAKPRKVSMTGSSTVAAHHGSYAPQDEKAAKKKHFWSRKPGGL